MALNSCTFTEIQRIRASSCTGSLIEIIENVLILVEAIEKRRPTSVWEKGLQILKKPHLEGDAQLFQKSLISTIELLSEKDINATRLSVGRYERDSKEGQSSKPTKSL
jgi:hypothetical protein